MVTYIATVGETIEAIVNTFWEFLIKCTLESDRYGRYTPSRFVALASKTDIIRGIRGTDEKIPEIRERIREVSRKVINREVEFIDRKVSQERPDDIIEEMLKIHEELKDDVYIVDITGGRKTMSVGATLGAIKLAKLGVEVKLIYFWLFNPAKAKGKVLSELAPGQDFELVEIDVSKILV